MQTVLLDWEPVWAWHLLTMLLRCLFLSVWTPTESCWERMERGRIRSEASQSVPLLKDVRFILKNKMWAVSYCMHFGLQQRICVFVCSCAVELSPYTRFIFLFYWYSSRVITTQWWHSATVFLSELTDNSKSSPAWRTGGCWIVFNHRLIWLIDLFLQSIQEGNPANCLVHQNVQDKNTII